MKKVILLVMVVLLNSPPVFALSPEQKRVIDSGAIYFDVERGGFTLGGSNSCATAALPAISDTAGVAAAIDTFIVARGGTGAPLEGMGAQIVEGAVGAGVNPFLVVSIALKESSFGTAGIAASGTYNAFGRTANDSQPNIEINGRKWYKWESWEDSLTGEDNQSEFLRRIYIEDRGLTNLQEVIFTYAPPSENNSDLYAQQINEWVQELITSSGSAISCGTSTTGGDAEANKQIARQQIEGYGWGDNEFQCLDNIWSQESGWDHTANNPTSSAYGIPQALINTHRQDIEANYSDFYDKEIQGTPGSPSTYDYEGGNPETQIRWGLEYIKGRYGTPCAAWAFKQQNGTY